MSSSEEEFSCEDLQKNPSSVIEKETRHSKIIEKFFTIKDVSTKSVKLSIKSHIHVFILVGLNKDKMFFFSFNVFFCPTNYLAQ